MSLKEKTKNNAVDTETLQELGFPILRNLSQIAFVYSDVVTAAKRYCSYYNIKPWIFYKYSSPNFEVSNQTVRGKKTDYGMLIGFAWDGPWMIELLQPLDENSLYAEFLRERNGKGGLHHLASFEVPDLQEAISKLDKLGIKTLQTGRFAKDAFSTNFAYMDTESTFGTIIELVHKVGDRPPPDFRYPE